MSSASFYHDGLRDTVLAELQRRQPPGARTPIRERNGCALYHNPLRQDTHPSLAVLEHGFYDRATAQKWNTIQFARELGVQMPSQEGNKVIYVYHSSDGKAAYRVVRTPDKHFYQQRPDGAGGWQNGIKGVTLVPYRLPQLLASDPSTLVYIVEGEKDADRLASLELIATCNPMGAGKWRDEYSQHLTGRPVVILADNDEPGRSHAETVARSCYSVARSVKLLGALPNVPLKGDVSDYLNAGHTFADLLVLIDAAPLWRPVEVAKDDPTPELPRKPAVPELHPEALYGFAGKFVNLIVPESEAHPAALLATLLVYAGALLGRGPHTLVGHKRHGTNLFAGLVGRTAGGRKGTSRPPVHELLKQTDSEFTSLRVRSGLSSGQGLIYHVRDKVTKPGKDGDVVVDEGESDKRLAAVEEELLSVIRQMAGDENTLSATIRQAWDGDDLSTLTKNSPMRATSPHISILGHATQVELLKYLTEVEMGNGFANRFMWVYVERSKLLPEGGKPVDLSQLAYELCHIVAWAERLTEPIMRNEPARALWATAYTHLTADRGGLFGAVTSRAEAQVLRLSLLYAVLDCSPVIDVPHLRAALMFWQYCEDSARYIFGNGTGDSIADRIYRALSDVGEMSLDDIYKLLGKNVKALRYRQALDLLESLGRLAQHKRPGEGDKPCTVYTLIQ